MIAEVGSFSRATCDGLTAQRVSDMAMLVNKSMHRMSATLCQSKRHRFIERHLIVVASPTALIGDLHRWAKVRA